MTLLNQNYARELPFSKKSWESDFKYWSNPKFKRVKGLGRPDKLEFKPLDKKTLQLKPSFVAIDTETYASNGNVICMCNSKNDKVLLGTTKKSPTLTDYFNYLVNITGENPLTVFVVYNLKFDAQIILKSLGKKITSLYFGETGNGEKYTGIFEDIKIKYIPKKMLSLRSVNDKEKKVIIYDAMQFFLGSGIKKKSDLDSVAEKYLGKHKEYDGKYQDKVFPDKIDQNELDKIIQYCKQDCVLAKQVMDIWIENFHSAFGFYPQKYHSMGSIAIDYLRTQLDYFPTFKYIPYDVNALAFNAYFGGRFEITERGLIQDIHHYDIRSAYPYAMSKMPDFTRGKWIKIKNIAEFKDNKELIGFYKITTTVKEKKIAPFMFRGKLGLVYCPSGTFITHTTSNELKTAVENYNVKIHKIQGYCFKPDHGAEHWEFNDIVNYMYRQRMSQTNEGQKYIFKIGINSLYGKTAQSKPEPRGIFNPVICSYITGYTRGMLLDAIKDNKDDITQLATDAIFSKKKLNNLPISQKLGDYEYNHHPKMIVIMAGVYSYNTDNDQKMQTKSRGFELRTINKKGEKVIFDIEDYKLNLKDGKYFYEIVNRNSIPASKIAMRHKGYTWQNIGKMELRKKEIDLNGDNKRLWSGYLTNIHGHNYSRPINADLIL